MFYNYSVEHVLKLRNTIASRRWLWKPDGFLDASVDVLHWVYNGIGPDAWSPKLRRFVTWLLSWFEAEALAHDFGYGVGKNRSYWAFTVENLRFAYNSIVNAIYDHGWFSKHTVILSVLGCVLALFCQAFGWGGFKAVVIPNKQKKFGKMIKFSAEELK